MHDIIVGLQYGDEGKGKITHHYVKNGNYTHCVRFNGGPNAGHTIYYKGMKVITHQIPTGIFYGLICVIGPGCFVDLVKLKKEIILIESLGIDVRNLLKISNNAHIITKKHINEDISHDLVGSTKSGIRPVSRDKYDRKGMLLSEYKGEEELFERIDSYEELNKEGNKILFEGAQGFMLDIDWGNYPYVTSSNTLSYYACSTGISMKKINKIYGVAKLYSTYVGSKKYQPDDNVFVMLQELGDEFGSTTGRMRQCNWLNLTELERAINMNGVTDLIINKCDIIITLSIFKLYDKDDIIEFNTFDDMKNYITDKFKDISIIFSYNKFEI